MRITISSVLLSTIYVVALAAYPIITLAALVNINTANSEELQTLDGIGEVKAQAIIDFRETNGPFQNKEDIMNVSGIGEVTYNNIKDSITVSVNQEENENDDEENSDDDENTSDESDTESSSENSGSKTVKSPVVGLGIFAPSTALVNQTIIFSVEPIEGSKDRLIRYWWNFGDAVTAEGKNPEHIYKYPGTYVVVVESYYLNKVITSRHEIEVLPTELTIAINREGDIEVKNISDYEVNLGPMRLFGRSVFEFPPHTILLPGASLTIPLGKVGSKSYDVIALIDQLDNVVASSNLPTIKGSQSVTTQPKVALISGNTPKPQVLGTFQSDVVEDESTASNTSISVAQADKAIPKASVPKQAPESDRSWTYLGLIGVIGIGFLALYSRKT